MLIPMKWPINNRTTAYYRILQPAGLVSGTLAWAQYVAVRVCNENIYIEPENWNKSEYKFFQGRGRIWRFCEYRLPPHTLVSWSS